MSAPNASYAIILRVRLDKDPTALGRATTAARGVGRAVQQSGDVKRAEETVGALRSQLDALEVQFQEDANWGPQNPTSGTPDPHRVHQVERGETLDRLAASYYGDSTQWRLIARANGIEDPLALEPGAILVIPKLKAGGRA